MLIYIERDADPTTAGVTLALTKPRLLALLGGDTDSPGIDITGKAADLHTLLSALDRADPSFDIVTP